MSERSRRPVSYDSPSRARWLRPLAFLLLAGCSPEPEAVSVVTEEECSPPELTDPSTCHLPPPALVDPTPDDPRPTSDLEGEVGFIEVEGGSCGASQARMFYSFRPAEEDSGTKPLLVLFNGGPGYPTSLGLLAYGTGPKSLTIPEGASPEAATFEDNPHSMTRFANLLYVDERDVGYSYLLGEAANGPCPEGDDVARDADDFVRVVLRFLQDHPPLRARPVVLVGESYGAFRAMSMLARLLHHAEHDDELATEIRDHFQRAFPDHKGEFSPRDVARQFGYLVSIQGALLSPHTGRRACPPVPEGRDPYDSSRLAGWSEAVSERALRLHAEGVDSDEIFGVRPGDIPGLSPLDRAGAWRAPEEDAAGRVVHEALTTELGELDPPDAYFRFYLDPAWAYDGEEPLLRVQPHVHIFATHAIFDRVICLESLLEATRTTIRTDLDDGALRPGRVWPEDPSGLCGCYSSLRVATYEAGHEVTVTQAAAFAEDVEAWLRRPYFSAGSTTE